MAHYCKHLAISPQARAVTQIKLLCRIDKQELRSLWNVRKEKPTAEGWLLQQFHATTGTTWPRIPKAYSGPRDSNLDEQLLLQTEHLPVPWQSVSTPAIKNNNVPAFLLFPFHSSSYLCFAYFSFHPLHCCSFAYWIKEHSNTEEMPLFEEEQTGTSCPTFDLDGSELLIFMQQLELLGTVPWTSHDSPTIL